MTAADGTCHSSSCEATDRCTFGSGHSSAVCQTWGRTTPPRQGDRLFATLKRPPGLRSRCRKAARRTTHRQRASSFGGAPPKTVQSIHCADEFLRVDGPWTPVQVRMARICSFPRFPLPFASASRHPAALHPKATSDIHPADDHHDIFTSSLPHRGQRGFGAPDGGSTERPSCCCNGAAGLP